MENNNDVVISSRVRLARNLKKYVFPHKLSEIAGEQLIEEVKKALKDKVLGEHVTYYDMADIPVSEKMSLVEGHIISPNMLKYKRPSGVFVYEDLGISIMVNEEDHLRIQCINDGMDLKGAYSLADRIDNLIEERLEYAYTEKYGFLTSCPTNTGTGLRASYMLHMPALETYGQLQIILQAIGKFGITVRGVHGEGTEAIGSVFQISNQITLGQSEEEIIQNLDNITCQIIEQEQKMRQRLLTKDRIEFEDKVYRSYGVLAHGRIMSYKEAMTLLSDVKLGAGMGIIDLNQGTFNIYTLMKLIQPAMLEQQVGKPLSLGERNIYRAQIIRTKLEEMGK